MGALKQVHNLCLGTGQVFTFITPTVRIRSVSIIFKIQFLVQEASLNAIFGHYKVLKAAFYQSVLS